MFRVCKTIYASILFKNLSFTHKNNNNCLIEFATKIYTRCLVDDGRVRTITFHLKYILTAINKITLKAYNKVYFY